MTPHGGAGPPTSMDVGERLRPTIPDGVFYDSELDLWSCLLCWSPPGHLAETCEAQSVTGKFCTRDPGHEGLHVACGPGAQLHPMEIWR